MDTGADQLFLPRSWLPGLAGAAQVLPASSRRRGVARNSRKVSGQVLGQAVACEMPPAYARHADVT
eukprot:2827215-Lingulodinium_polyedra.AAC.1